MYLRGQRGASNLLAGAARTYTVGHHRITRIEPSGDTILPMSARKAIDILRQHWDRALPVDPAAIALNMGVTVLSDPEIAPASGTFNLTGDGPTIRFNSREPKVRQRFTIAHELGHYALAHGDAFRDTSGEFSASNFDLREVSANQFAAALLIPKAAVDEVISQGTTQLAELARIFEVSEAAMRYRLKDLGWVD